MNIAAIHLRFRIIFIPGTTGLQATGFIKVIPLLHYSDCKILTNQE